VGSQACTGCHDKEVAEWHNTWHSKMEQWPTPETVVGEFNDQIITYQDVEATDDKGAKWQRQMIDDGGVAVEDLTIADLNGDGRPDIIAVGRATKNVRIYWNETGK